MPPAASKVYVILGSPVQATCYAAPQEEQGPLQAIVGTSQPAAGVMVMQGPLQAIVGTSQPRGRAHCGLQG